MKQIKVIYKSDNLAFKYLVVFNNCELGLRLSCTKHVSYACLEVDGMDKYFEQGDFGEAISFNDLSPRVKAAVRSFAWGRGLKYVRLNKVNIEFIAEKFFPNTRAFLGSWLVKETKKTFHLTSKITCYDRNGGFEGKQRFTIIVNKKWKQKEFKLVFNAPRYLSDKHDLREYMEDAIDHSFSRLFEK